MAWIPYPLPECIAFGAIARSSWFTIVTEQQNAQEQRTQSRGNWRLEYDFDFSNRNESDYRALRSHFAMARGRKNSFAMRDFTDYQVGVSEGIAVQTAPGVFQLTKSYGIDPYAYYRPITRPVIVEPYRGGVVMVAGVGAGQYAFDNTTGLLTVQPDQSRGINSHAVGATHQFTLASAFSPNVVNGNTIYVSGITGTAASLLNNQALTVTAVASGVISVNRNTTGLTASGGTAYRRIAASEITWLGTFNVPVRYDIDTLQGQAIDRNEQGLWISPNGVRVIEVMPGSE